MGTGPHRLKTSECQELENTTILKVEALSPSWGVEAEFTAGQLTSFFWSNQLHKTFIMQSQSLPDNVGWEIHGADFLEL